MLYSQPRVQQSILGHILAFIAEGPGAQLFMLLMGVSFTLSNKITTGHILKRSVSLLSAAYLLNFFKFLAPLGFAFFPDELLKELNIENDFNGAMFLLTLGDILHFASFATIITMSSASRKTQLLGVDILLT